MQVNDELLGKLERLGAIELEGSRREEVKKQLSEIVAFVENINTLNLEELDDSFLAIEQSQPMREDIPIMQDGIAKDILSHAPKVENDFFIVPKIIE